MPTGSPLAQHVQGHSLPGSGVLNRGLIFPALIVAAVAIIVTPLPAVLMDMLLACNFALAVVVLLTAIQVRKPLDFSVFPTLLLGTTLFRLVLNVASTRLILTKSATDGPQAAGGIIEAFGQFVAGGSLMVGLVMFAILLTIQFVVITKGSTRVSEVAARFVLDGLPGRQAAIDADLSSGVITKEQARRQRDELLHETDFYGAMDGAGRFVRGDALAGLVIVAINIIGGLYVGVIENGMAAGDALGLFMSLTIGDGLVSQLPAFLIALATGLIVTRASHRTDISTDIVNQVTGQPVALVIAGVLFAMLSFTGLPAFPMLVLSLACFAIAFISGNETPSPTAKPQDTPQPTSPRDREDSSHLSVELLELQLGLRATQLVRDSDKHDLLERMKKIRGHLARDLGMIMPPVRISDSVHLGAREYQLLIRGVPVADDKVYVDALLAIEPNKVEASVPGIDAVDPALQKPARWIEPADRTTAEARGYTVVSPSAVIATHLSRIVQKHAPELLTRQQVHKLVARLRKESPQLVEEVVPQVVSISTLHQVLTLLLAESVSIRDLETILETLADYSREFTRPKQLVEPVRQALGRTICQRYRDAKNNLHSVMLDPELEHTIADELSQSTPRRMSAGLIELVRNEIKSAVRSNAQQRLVVLCTAGIRQELRHILMGPYASLAVISFEEITSDTNINVVSTIGITSHFDDVNQTPGVHSTSDAVRAG
ncbi:flagellar biosynthesis protein FlhA [bacterium]|nr:flagellar biosynthesis protein FlhA [bacterium]